MPRSVSILPHASFPPLVPNPATIAAQEAVPPSPGHASPVPRVSLDLAPTQVAAPSRVNASPVNAVRHFPDCKGSLVPTPVAADGRAGVLLQPGREVPFPPKVSLDLVPRVAEPEGLCGPEMLVPKLEGGQPVSEGAKCRVVASSFPAKRRRPVGGLDLTHLVAPDTQTSEGCQDQDQRDFGSLRPHCKWCPSGAKCPFLRGVACVRQNMHFGPHLREPFSRPVFAAPYAAQPRGPPDSSMASPHAKQADAWTAAENTSSAPQAPCRVPGPPGQAVPQSAEVEGSPGGNGVDATQGAAGRQVSQGEQATLPEPVCACPEPVFPANWQGVDEEALSLITVTSGASLSTQVDPTATGEEADVGSGLPSKAHDERHQRDVVQPHKKARLEGAQRHGNAAPGLPPVLPGLAYDARQESFDVVGVCGQNQASHFRPCREAEPEPLCHAPQPVLQGSFGTAGHGQSQATAGSLGPEIDDASRCGTKTSSDVPRRDGSGKCPRDVTHSLPKPVFPDPKPALTPHPRVNEERPLGKVDLKHGLMNNGTPCQVVGSNRLAGEDGQLQIPKAVLVPYRGRSSSTVAHILAALGGQDRLLVAFDSSLRLLPRQMVVPQDQEIFVWRPDVRAGRGMPPGFRAPFPTDLPHAQIMAPAARKRILLEQQGWVADDQAAFALSLIAACARSPVKVIPPLTAQALFENADLQGVKDTIGCLRECDSLVTMFLVGNLWIGASWTVEGKQVRAWSTACPKGEVGEALGQVDCLVAKALGSQVRDFRFSSAPSRPPAHGLCGHFALADLLYHVLGLEAPSLDQALSAAALLSAAFELGLNADRLVSAPHLLGGGPSLLEAGLAATLREHGVPAAQAVDRAIEVIQTIHKAGIQKALEGPQAWKELKALATSAKLQLVLPSELQAVAAARGPARRRQRQTAPSHRAEGSGPTNPPAFS